MIGILVSGGVDSAVLLDLASKRKGLVMAIYINWGQPAHWFEDTASIRLCDHYGIKRAVINAHHMMSVQMDMAIGIGKKGPRFIRGRNLAFLSMACVQYFFIEQIWIGCCKTDWENYVDCTPDFIRRADSLFSLYDVQICAPLLKMDKKQIHEYAQKCNVPLGLAWSCYQDADGDPCGRCDSCVSNDPRSWQ